MLFVGGQEVERNSVVVLRWLARMSASAIIALVLLFAVMHSVSPDAPQPTSTEWVGMLFFPFGVCAGLVAAWRWEGTGGLISVASLAVFYAWMAASGGKTPGGPFLLLIAVPGLVFVLCRVLSGNTRRRGGRLNCGGG